MNKSKTSRRLMALLLASGSVVLISCSDGSSGSVAMPTPTPSPSPTPTPTPTPEPSPDPTPAPQIIFPDASSPGDAANQLGSGFSFAFGDGPTAEPRDPQSTDIVGLDLSGDPIDISNTD